MFPSQFFKQKQHPKCTVIPKCLKREIPCNASPTVKSDLITVKV